MTPKQEIFIREYLVDLNATAAYRRAGYKSGNPDVDGPALLGKPGIAQAIQKAMSDRAERVELKAERVLREITRSAFLDPKGMFNSDGTLMSIHDIPEDLRRAIAGFEVVETFEMMSIPKLPGDTGPAIREKVWTGYLKKVKLVSKSESLDQAGRHLRLFSGKNDETSDGPVRFSPMDLSRWTREDLATLQGLIEKYSKRPGEVE